MRGEDAPEAHRVEAHRHDHGPAGGEGGERAADQAVDVEEGHHAERGVERREPVGRDDVAGRADQVAVPERGALRPAGRPAAVQHERHVVGPRAGRGAPRPAADRRLEPELAVGLDLDLAMRILEGRFKDLAGDGERFRRVVSAPAVMGDGRSRRKERGQRQEHATGD